MSGITLVGRGRDLDEIDLAVRFDREICRWEVLGKASEVHRSKERYAILEALKNATEPMTPVTISEETGISRANVRQLLRRMKDGDEVLRGNKKALYAHPDNPHFLK